MKVESIVFTGTETACRNIVKNFKRGIPVYDAVRTIVGNVTRLRYAKEGGRSVVLATMDVDQMPAQPYRSIEIVEASDAATD